MRANRRKDTRPETRLRSLLHRRGLRFRKDYRAVVPGFRSVRLDIAFTRIKVAVFVDGCFWHGCEQHKALPRTNVAYWHPKIRATVARDLTTDAALQAAGWLVMRVWEHMALTEAADLIDAAVQERNRCSDGTQSVANASARRSHSAIR